MNENNVLLLAIGDGAINIVNQNKDKLSDYFSVATIHKDAKQEFDENQWRSMLRLIIPKNVKYVCVLNCLGGDDDLTIQSTLGSAVFQDIVVIGAFVFPFSFEGNSCYKNANIKMHAIEKGIPPFEYVVFEEDCSRLYFCDCAIKFFNDDMLLHFPNLPFEAALRRFNEEICDGIISYVNEFIDEVRSVPKYD
ncbi:MAG: hypothetical protein J6Y55_07100 [Bacteroidales bacterium]|nr:hypothetical protein [Bacteroidales bacterium]